MECSYGERHERNLHLKKMIALADRRMRRGEAAAAAGWCEQVGTEPSRAQSQAPSNAPVTASQTSDPLLIGKETSSTDADDLQAATGETAPASTRLRPRLSQAAATASPAGMAAAWLVASAWNSA